MIVIRKVDTSDASTVAELTRALISELAQKTFEAEDFRRRAEQVLRHQGCWGLLALDHELPVGVMMLCEGAAIYAEGMYGVITELYVVPDYRSHGVARQLLDSARQLAHSNGWKRLEVGAPRQPQWARSLAFYESNGFSVIGPRLRLLIDQ